MNIFVIHCGKDIKNNNGEIKEKIQKIKKEAGEKEVTVLGGKSKAWKQNARKRIQNAELIVAFAGESFAANKNVNWELKKAVKYDKKIITVKLEPDCNLPEVLNTIDEFTGKTEIEHEVKTIEELLSFIQEQKNKDYNLFNLTVDDTNKETLLEQYKVFLETSEKLVERRQAVSNFYVTVNTAIFGVYTAFATIVGDSLWKYVTCLGFPVLGILLCRSWIHLLRSYGTLNASKMKIINIIEKKLPASLYDAEWAAQCDKLNKKAYVPFTEIEVNVPKIFICLYTILSVICLILLIRFLCVSNIPITPGETIAST